jgi:putative oxidoreductase
LAANALIPAREPPVSWARSAPRFSGRTMRMGPIFHIGRVLFVLIFVWSGLGKLMDIAGTAQMIAAKVPIPAAMTDLTGQIETALGMPTAQLLAIAAGLIEVIAALLIIFNLGTRWVAALMVLFTIATTFFFHDFWNLTGAARTDNMIHAFKNVSLIGGFLMLVALGSWRPLTAPRTY